MADKVKLIIEILGSGVMELEADGVVIPAIGGDITVLSERAPSIFATDFGMIKLLDKNLQSKESYYVSSGVADVAQGVLKLLTGKVLKSDEITKSEAEAKAQDDAFYRMIVDRMNNKTDKYC